MFKSTIKNLDLSSINFSTPLFPDAHGRAFWEAKVDKTIIQKAESYLTSLGFRDFRVRSEENTARLQVTEKDLPHVLKQRGAIINELKQHYKAVLLDLEVRK